MAGFKANAGAEAGIAYRIEQSPTLLAGNNDASVCIAGFSQAAYDKFISDDKTATLKARGGTYGGGSETLIVQDECVKGFPLGFRAENTKLYDDKATTLCNGTRPGYCNGVITPVAVDTSHADDVARVDEISSPLQARDYKGGKLVCSVDCRNGTENSVNGTLQNRSAHSLNCNNTVRQEAIVRRLTPLECERLQGFPDGWTDIGEWVDDKGKAHKDSDSPRYKALGNSIAIPPWFYVLMKLNLCCGEDRTMASLFDGIGGFPLIWEMLNGKGSCLWASEIEDFPIAVTKIRFSEEDAI